MNEVPQPSGTVTLVFTDIEGSTRLLEQLGTDAYREALGEHRMVVREAFVRREGYEVDYEGDSFFYAFGSAQDAVAAVAEALEGLAAGPIRIRVGVHTGEPGLDPPKYVGMDVHRAARLMAAAHGGQVVVSQSTAALLRPSGSEPQALVLRDLGEHRFKDLAAPERVFQLGGGEFPPIRSLHRSNLPVPATPFVGRAAELSEVVERLTDPTARVLTLSGPGGTGKTRLAVQAAAVASDAFPDGVFWVPVAPLRDPALILSRVAQSLGVQEEAGRELADTLGARLSGQRLLIVLDNLEHLLPRAASAVATLRDLAGSVVLVTSRERLRVAGEDVYAVSGLGGNEATELFVARARAASVALEAGAPVEDLCGRLDNLPLAIELAAARTPVFSPEQLLDRLGQRLDLLAGGRDADPRQQTLRAAIEWSYDLLDDGEAAVFRALGVFAGGCVYEAAEQIAGADADSLQSLIDKSLLQRRTGAGGEPRYWMLETIRQYAVGRQEGDIEPARARHSIWIGAWARHLDVRDAGQARTLPALRDEIPNIRLALEHLAATGQTCSRLELVSVVAPGMFQLGMARESAAWFAQAFEADDACAPTLRARGRARASIQASLSGDPELGALRAREAADVGPTPTDPALRAELLLAASVAQLGLKNLDAAERLAGDALMSAREAGDLALVGDLRNNLSYVAMLAGKLPLARQTAEDALEEARNRNDLHLIAILLQNLSLIALAEDDLEAASRALHEALALAQRAGLEQIMYFAIQGVASLSARSGSPDVAAMLLGATRDPVVEAGEVEVAQRRRTEATVRSGLASDAIETFEALGAALTLPEAADRAQEWLQQERDRSPSVLAPGPEEPTP